MITLPSKSLNWVVFKIGVSNTMISAPIVFVMTDIDITEEERDGQEIYAALDMGEYARKTFGMFTGEEISVQLRFENHLVGAVIDRLGRDVMLIPDGPDHFTVRTDVVVSPQFFAWVCGFGNRAKILEPEHVVADMKAHLWKISSLYEGE